MADDVLKSFLVSLGYRVDGNSQRNFESSIRSATLQATLLADALEALAKKAAQAIAGVAKGYDQLYFTSARTGASVQNIKALGYAFSQVGGSVGDAQAAIEGFAKAARTNPGTKQLLKDLGVANGGDTVGTMRNLSAKMQNSPHYIGAQYAGILGLSEEQFLLLKSGKLDEYLGEYAKTIEHVGFNQKQAADRGYEFSRALGSLSMTVDILGEKIATDMMPPLTEFLKSTKEWVIAHKDDIAEVITNIASAAKESAGHFTALVAALKPAWEAFDETVKKLTGSTGLTVAFDLLAISLATRVLLPLRAISLLLLGLKAPAWLLGLLGVQGLAGVAAGVVATGHGFQTPEQAAANPDQAATNAEANGRVGAIKRAWQNRPGWLGGSSTPAMPKGDKLKNMQESYSFWRSKGLTHEQAAGLVANESAESKFNPGARGDGGAAHGIFQHHADRRAAILGATGINMSDASHLDQLRGAYWEMTQGSKENRIWDALRGTTTAGEAGALVANRYERPLRNEGPTRGAMAEGFAKALREQAGKPRGDVVGSAGAFKLAKVAKRASGDLGIFGSPNRLSDFGAFEPSQLSDGGFTMNNVKMVHTTNVNVNGAGDPKSTALAIGRHQDGVNARALTHAQGAIR